MTLPKRNWMEMTWQDVAGADTARWIAVLPLAAVEQHAPQEWHAYLERACAGDEELRGQVARLLEAHRQEGSLPGRAALGVERDAFQVHAGSVAAFLRSAATASPMDTVMTSFRKRRRSLDTRGV